MGESPIRRIPCPLVDIKLILVTDIANEEDAINPYLKVLDSSGDQKFKTSIQKNKTAAAWGGLNQPFRTELGAPIFIEIWNSVTLRDPLIGMFTIYPESGQTDYVEGIVWDISKRSSTKRVGLGKVTMAIFDEQQ